MQSQVWSSALDELVIDALAGAPTVIHTTTGYAKLEVVTEDDLDIAVTGRFLRWSAPYERVELDAALGSPMFAQPAETIAFDKQWFDEAELVAIEEPVAAPRGSWTWLAISVAVAAIAVGLAEYAL
jgi:hypothetical protein